MAQKRLSQTELSVFCTSLSMLLEAGTPAAEACSLFAQDNGGLSGTVAAAMAAEMDGGSPFAQAAESTGAFPEYAVGVFQTAEYAGRLDNALSRLGDYYARQDALTQRLKSTLTYPAALVLMMCGVLAVLVFGVMPMFLRAYGSMTGGLAASSYAYVRAAEIIGKVCLALAVIAAAALLSLGAMLRSRKGSEELLRGMERFPLSRKAVRGLETAKLADSLATLLASGTNPDEALEQAAALVNNAPLKKSLEECAEILTQGESLAAGLYRSGIFSRLYGRMLVSAGESGNLEEVLCQLSKKLEAEAEDAFSDIIDSIEPVLIGFLTVSVGLTLLSVMLPLLGLLGAV